jgi:hypothetical protein
LLIQRLPLEGVGNLAGSMVSCENEDEIGLNEHYNRISDPCQEPKGLSELLDLDVDTVLRRLFWEEPVTRFEPLLGDTAPRFTCNCSRERVAKMIVSLGREEAESILSERSDIEVGCEFCGAQTGSTRWMRPSFSRMPSSCSKVLQERADVACSSPEITRCSQAASEHFSQRAIQRR